MAAFAAGDCNTAAARLQVIVDQAPPDAKIEVVYLTLASACIRSERYAQAAEILRRFLEKYPASKSLDDATVSLAYAALKAGDYSAAVASYKQLETKPEFRERALLGQAKVYFEWQQYDNAITTLRMLVGSGVKSAAAADGLLLLADCQVKTGTFENAITTLRQLRENVSYLTNIFRLNTAAFRLGDQLVESGKSPLALDCYHLVLSKQKVIALQEAGLGSMKRQMMANMNAVRADPRRISEFLGQNTFLAQSLNEASKTLAEYKGMPDFSSAFLLRLARAYSDTKQHWEALAVYGEFLRRYPEDPQRQAAMFGIVVESAETGRLEETRRYGEIYLAEFPLHPNADAVGYLLGSSLLEANDPQGAETYFGRMIKDQPNSKFKDRIRFLLGNARFDLGKYDLAINDYRRYLADFPAGDYQEEAAYRIGLCQLAMGRYDDASATISDYLKTHPNGFFLSDANYRLGVCKFSLSQYPEVISDCEKWERDYSGDALLGEVLALKADAQVEVGKPDEALETYKRSYNGGKNEAIVVYSIFAMKKLLQKKRDWKQMETIFTDFVNRYPTSPAVLSGVVAITQAKARQGKTDEARLFVADVVLLTIDDAGRENVEDLLTQLAILCVKARKPSAAGARSTPIDPQGELGNLLASARGSKSAVAQARLLYANAEICRLKKNQSGRDDALKTLANKFQPEGLSPALLAMVGDYFLKNGDPTKAGACYTRLLKIFSKSAFRQYAAVGLGEIALRQGRGGEALRQFNDAIVEDGANIKLKDAMLGKANALFALGRLDEARAIFEAVASTREWRGEATAISIFTLGEIEKKNGNLPKAISYYEKVYMGYRLYLPWVAKAYSASAACSEELGNFSRARNTYEELLKNDKLSNFTEYGNARKRLETMDKG